MRLAHVLVTVLLGTLIEAEAVAQAPPGAGTPTVETVTPEVVQTRRRQAEQAADLDEATKQKVLEAYDQAIAMLDAAATSAARAAELQGAIDSVPSQTEKTNSELSKLAAASPETPGADTDLETAKRVRAEKAEALSKAKERLAALETEITGRVTGEKEFRGLINSSREQLTRVNQELQLPASPDTPPTVALAQRTLLAAQRQTLEQSIAAYEKELASYAATVDLLPLEQRLEAMRASLLQEEVRRWQEAEHRLMQQEAKRQADQARKEAAEADPGLRKLAVANRELAKTVEELAQSILTESKKCEEITAKLDEVKKQYKGTENRVNIIGLTNAIGFLMRARRAALPDVSEHYREIRLRQEEIRDLEARLFDLEDRRLETADLERQIELALAEARSVGTNLTPEELEAAVRDLVTRHGEYLDAATKNHHEFLRTLVDLDDAQRQLIDAVEEYATYIDERVLWISSADPLRLSDPRHAAGIVKHGMCLDGWPAWVDVADAQKSDFVSHPFTHAIALCVFAVWLGLQRRLRSWLARAGRTAARSTEDRLLPTLEACAFTILIAAIWPAVLWYLAWRIAAPLDATDFAKALSAGLVAAAEWWLPLELLRQVCRKGGLAEIHFGWAAGSVRVARRHLRWFVPAGLPVVFVMALMDSQAIERWQNSLGRLTFMALMVLVVVLTQSMLRPRGSLFRHLLTEGRESWFYRARHACYWTGTVAPLALIVAASVGYYYTAQQLAARLRDTVFLAFSLAVVGAVLSRWTLVIRRRLGIQRARQRRAAASAEGASTAAQPAVAGFVAPTSDAELDLSTMRLQTRRFLNSLLLLAAVFGMWWIWADVLPALGILDEIELWSTTVKATEIVTTGDVPITRTVDRLEPITLADLGLAVLVFLMTGIAAKNVPGLLGIAMPQRLPLDAGARFAITTIAQYLVIVFGVILGCGILGIGWSKVQWLVAALSVGLGFGLQEIFANFVSGLIILFERPIRLGDVVTVDDVTGVVTRIQTRATTVTNWDRKEFIVPNKEFVTGRLLNWTRADHINRVVINVGIAYGSDTELARNLLLEVVGSHPEVMSDPAPLVTFEGFGDSSLSFVVRCYLPRMDNRLATIHDLHTAIDQAFREAGIEIAFPQRDIHVRSDAESKRGPEASDSPNASEDAG